jgi:hypothetical protein
MKRAKKILISWVSLLAVNIAIVFIVPAFVYAGGTTTFLGYTPTAFNLQVSEDCSQGSACKVVGDGSPFPGEIKADLKHNDPPQGLFQSCDKVKGFNVIVDGRQKIFRQMNNGRPLCSFGPGDYCNPEVGCANNMISGLDPLSLTRYCVQHGSGKITKNLEVELVYNSGSMEKVAGSAKAMDINVQCPKCANTPLQFLSPARLSSPPSSCGVPYKYQLLTSYQTVTYSITSGSLPSGLSMSPSGLISGKPMVPNAEQSKTFSFTVKASATCMGTARTVDMKFDLPLYPNDCSGDMNFVPPFTLPSGSLNGNYQYQLKVRMPVRNVTYKLADGSKLPQGLSLTPSGIIQGRPLSSGKYTFTVVSLSDCPGCIGDIPPSGQGNFTLEVVAPRIQQGNEGSVIQVKPPMRSQPPGGPLPGR